MYSVINQNVFALCFSGALSGTGFGNRAPTITDYSKAIAVANAFAQAVDTVWNSSVPIGIVEAAVFQDACDSVWQNRGATGSPSELNPATWIPIAESIVSAALESINLFLAQGYPNPPYNSAPAPPTVATVISAGFDAPTSTKTYPRNTTGPGGIGVQAEKSPGVELAAVLSQVPGGSIVEVAFSIGGDLSGLSAQNNLIVNPTVKVGSLAASTLIIAGSEPSYIGANNVRMSLSMTAAFQWTGPTSDLYIGLALRLAGADPSDSLLVYNSQIQAPPCNINAKAWTGLPLTSIPLTPLITPP